MLFERKKDEVIAETLVNIEKFLRKSELSEISEDKEVEFYLNDFQLKEEVNNTSDVISRCIAVLRKVLDLALYEGTIEDFIENAEIEDIITILANPNGILEIEFNLRLFDNKLGYYKTIKLVCSI